MSAAKAAVAEGRAAPLPPDLTQIAKEYARVVRDIEALGHRVGDAIRARPAHAGGHLRHTVEAMRPLLQRWNLELLYLVAVWRVARFSELQAQLEGISSRTLSLRLKQLEDLGLVLRTVHTGRPLRVEYAITERGRSVADLTVPLVLFLMAKGGGVAPVLHGFLGPAPRPVAGRR